LAPVLHNSHRFALRRADTTAEGMVKMQNVTRSKTPELNGLSDEALVSLAKDGNDRAFEELMRRSWDKSLRLALCHLHDREDAVDEVQGAYWNAYQHLSTFTGQAKFSTWVGRIVINRCIMRIRSNKRAKLLSFDHMPTVSEGPNIQDTYRWCNPEEQLGSNQVSELIKSELRCVPKLLRTAVEMRHIQGLSLDEIGSQLGINLGAVKTRVSRGNQYLRDRMVRHLGERGVASLTP
jgi:RNA polymerase sigma-70 factor (ECF subfamily)